MPETATDQPEAGDSGQQEEAPTPEDNRIMELLTREMKKQHAYREAGLTAELLAHRLGIHRNALAHAISKKTGNNFSHFINSYRIREAVRLLSSPGDNKIYLDEVYEQVGFNNRTTFYRSFKQFTGLSPVEFLRNHEKGEGGGGETV